MVDMAGAIELGGGLGGIALLTYVHSMSLLLLLLLLRRPIQLSEVGWEELPGVASLIGQMPHVTVPGNQHC